MDSEDNDLTIHLTNIAYLLVSSDQHKFSSPFSLKRLLKSCSSEAFVSLGWPSSTLQALSPSTPVVEIQAFVIGLADTSASSLCQHMVRMFEEFEPKNEDIGHIIRTEALIKEEIRLFWDTLQKKGEPAAKILWNKLAGYDKCFFGEEALTKCKGAHGIAELKWKKVRREVIKRVFGGKVTVSYDEIKVFTDGTGLPNEPIEKFLIPRNLSRRQLESKIESDTSLQKTSGNITAKLLSYQRRDNNKLRSCYISPHSRRIYHNETDNGDELYPRSTICKTEFKIRAGDGGKERSTETRITSEWTRNQTRDFEANEIPTFIEGYKKSDINFTESKPDSPSNKKERENRIRGATLNNNLDGSTSELIPCRISTAEKKKVSYPASPSKKAETILIYDSKLTGKSERICTETYHSPTRKIIKTFFSETGNTMVTEEELDDKIIVEQNTALEVIPSKEFLLVLGEYIQLQSQLCALKTAVVVQPEFSIEAVLVLDAPTHFGLPYANNLKDCQQYFVSHSAINRFLVQQKEPTSSLSQKSKMILREIHQVEEKIERCLKLNKQLIILSIKKFGSAEKYELQSFFDELMILINNL